MSFKGDGLPQPELPEQHEVLPASAASIARVYAEATRVLMAVEDVFIVFRFLSDRKSI